MILPDVNTLAYAFHRDTAEHERFAAWLDAALTDAEPILLPDTVLTGFLRIVTNRRIFTDPSPAPVALAFAESLRNAPAIRPLPPTQAAWRQLARFIESDSYLVGNLIPDAWIASLAVTSGAQVATADAGFSRFDGLTWFNPALRIEQIVHFEQQRQIDQEIVDGYIRCPPTKEEEQAALNSIRDAISEEPW